MKITIEFNISDKDYKQYEGMIEDFLFDIYDITKEVVIKENDEVI